MVPYQTRRPTSDTTPSAEFLHARRERREKRKRRLVGQYATQSMRYLDTWVHDQSYPSPAVNDRSHCHSCHTALKNPGFSHTQDRAEATLTAELAGSSCRAAHPLRPLRQSRHWALQNVKACPITAASAATPPPSWLQISFSLKRLVSLQHCDPVQKNLPVPSLPPSSSPFAALPSTSSPVVTSRICPNSCLLETFPGSINPSLRCARSHASSCRPFLGVSLPPRQAHF